MDSLWLSPLCNRRSVVNPRMDALVHYIGSAKPLYRYSNSSNGDGNDGGVCGLNNRHHHHRRYQNVRCTYMSVAVCMYWCVRVFHQTEVVISNVDVCACAYMWTTLQLKPYGEKSASHIHTHIRRHIHRETIYDMRASMYAARVFKQRRRRWQRWLYSLLLLLLFDGCTRADNVAIAQLMFQSQDSAS